jgi:hypothetical protein
MAHHATENLYTAVHDTNQIITCFSLMTSPATVAAPTPQRNTLPPARLPLRSTPMNSNVDCKNANPSKHFSHSIIEIGSDCKKEFHSVESSNQRLHLRKIQVEQEDQSTSSFPEEKVESRQASSDACKTIRPYCTHRTFNLIENFDCNLISAPWYSPDVIIDTDNQGVTTAMRSGTSEIT